MAGHCLQFVTQRIRFESAFQFHHFTLQMQLLHLEVFYSVVVISYRIFQVDYLQSDGSVKQLLDHSITLYNYPHQFILLEHGLLVALPQLL